MELMHPNALFSSSNVMKTQRIQYLPPMVLKKKQNSLVVKSLFFRKPPQPPPVSSPAYKVIMEPLQKVFKQIPVSGMKVLKLIDSTFPDSELKVALFQVVAGSLGWALPAIGIIILSIAQENPFHFKVGDVVVYKGEDYLVKSIYSSSIVLESVFGPIRLDNSDSLPSMITNVSREVATSVGTRTVFTFEIIFDVREKEKEICDIIQNYMNTNQYLKDQHLYNFAIILQDDKIQVVGNLSCVDLSSPNFFESYTEIKSNIIADLSQIVDENKPNQSCAMCKALVN